MRLKNTLSKLAGDRSGTIGITFVVMSTLIVTASAFAIETARIVSRKEVIQAVSDSAALQGARLIAEGKMSDGEIAVALKDFILAQMTGKNAGALDEGQTTIDVNSAAGTVRIAAVADYDAIIPFLSFSPAAMTALTSATTAPSTTDKQPGICGMAFNVDASKAMHFNGDGAIASDQCIFWSNSKTKDATQGYGSGGAQTARVCSVGSYAASLGYSVAPPPEDRCAPLADPMAGWKPPVVDWSACTYGAPGAAAKYDGAGMDMTLYPGTYCGGLDVANVRNLTFAPGRYFIGGKMVLATDVSITGENVYFQLSSDDAGADFRANSLKLSARNDAALGGVVVYKEPGGTKAQAVTFQARTGFSLNGIVYLPEDEAMFKIARPAGMAPDRISVLAEIVTWDIDKGDTYAMKPAIKTDVDGNPAPSSATGVVRLTN